MRRSKNIYNLKWERSTTTIPEEIKRIMICGYEFESQKKLKNGHFLSKRKRKKVEQTNLQKGRLKGGIRDLLFMSSQKSFN